jgi:hypothetical protein
MRLATKQISIDMPPASFTLKPSLRAAFNLEFAYGSFENLYKAVLAAKLSAFSDVIKEGTGNSSALTDYLDSTEALPLSVCLNLWVKPVADFVVALVGPQSPSDAGKVDNPITANEFHNRLFAIATGWLGWTPDQAWDATPAEILVAYEGHLERLRAIHGGKEDQSTDLTKLDAEQRRSHLKRLARIGDLTKSTVT